MDLGMTGAGEPPRQEDDEPLLARTGRLQKPDPVTSDRAVRVRIRQAVGAVVNVGEVTAYADPADPSHVRTADEPNGDDSWTWGSNTVVVPEASALPWAGAYTVVQHRHCGPSAPKRIRALARRTCCLRGRGRRRGGVVLRWWPVCRRGTLDIDRSHGAAQALNLGRWDTTPDLSGGVG
ncbi:hypothetical protein [Amycolatopsis sp. DSM 110486]|uniref:hypothetical protein n=1 Tax=Amycolatopsis sp. DSM 110486 TaxID=2865832 RepID=UPI001C6A6716|nr:hypothetical protein [Amycolatopsis sp. DSM 110486]QYN21467.1 hypothetical protein K1T34_02605 [Amycolatopsis sp. DSM 110486]